MSRIGTSIFLKPPPTHPDVPLQKNPSSAATGTTICFWACAVLRFWIPGRNPPTLMSRCGTSSWKKDGPLRNCKFNHLTTENWNSDFSDSIGIIDRNNSTPYSRFASSSTGQDVWRGVFQPAVRSEPKSASAGSAVLSNSGSGGLYGVCAAPERMSHRPWCSRKNYFKFYLI